MLVLVLRPDFELGGASFFLGATGVVLSEALRIWAVGYAGSTTRTRGDYVGPLFEHGPYRWTRNPLYIGNILLYCAFTFLFGHWFLTFFSLVYFCLQYRFIVSYEEDLLIHRLGESYEAYCKKVPRWLFGSRRLDPTTPSRAFDLAGALRSERSTLFAIGGTGLLWLTRLLWQRH